MNLEHRDNSTQHGPLGPIARTAEYDNNDAADNRDTYYLRDGMGGHTGLLTDEDDNLATPQRFSFSTYDAFGNHMSPGRPPSQSGSFAWRGAEGSVYDSHPALVYMQARHYDPTIGRFIQPDSLAMASMTTQGMNRFIYCENDPVNATDPSGHSPITDLLKLIWKWSLPIRIPLNIISLFSDIFGLAEPCFLSGPQSMADVLDLLRIQLAITTLLAVWGAALSILLLPVTSSLFGFFFALGILSFIGYAIIKAVGWIWDLLVERLPTEEQEMTPPLYFDDRLRLGQLILLASTRFEIFEAIELAALRGDLYGVT
jgi:RHS repeat-associated protein